MTRFAAALLFAGCSFSGQPGNLADGDAAVDSEANPDAAADARSGLGPWNPPLQLSGLTPLGSEGSYDDPSITDDLLEIYFAASVPQESDEDIYVATRASPEVAFGPATLLEPLSSSGPDVTPVVSGDGLVAMVSRDVGSGDFDLFISVREGRDSPFPTPQPIPEATALAINSAAFEATGFVSADRMTLIFASNRDGGFDLFRATRTSVEDPFDDVTKVPLSSPSTNEISPSLTADGLGLYYTVSGAPQRSLDIFFASRDSLEDSFTRGAPVAELNSDETDSDMREAAGRRFGVLASDRDNPDGLDRIFAVAR